MIVHIFLPTHDAPNVSLSRVVWQVCTIEKCHACAHFEALPLTTLLLSEPRAGLQMMGQISLHKPGNACLAIVGPFLASCGNLQALQGSVKKMLSLQSSPRSETQMNADILLLPIGDKSFSTGRVVHNAALVSDESMLTRLAIQ